MFTREDAIITVKLFTDKILEKGIPLDKVILFGSYANNNQREFSDIDVALVSNVFSGFGFDDRRFFSRINNEINFIDIEPQTYPTEYFEKGDPFINEIIKTGIEIYNSNSKS